MIASIPIPTSKIINTSDRYLFDFSAPSCPNMEGAIMDKSDTPTATVGKVLKKLKSNAISDTVADVPIPPDGASFIDINITKQFRWTKTAKHSTTVDTIPTITLREYVVAVPAFFQNMKLITEQLFGSKGDQWEGPASTVKAISEKLPSMFRTPILNALSGSKAIADAVNEGVKVGFDTTKFEMPSYLKSYENIYGVKKTNFIYRVPYLEDAYKSISNTWGTQENLLTSPIQALGALATAISPGIGIDFAKTFQYPQNGPSYNINFYLDNTRYDDITEWKKNYRLVYLLAYQNLPNRINRTALTPPVIYQSSLPGVFSYRWSFLSKININFVGVRRRMPPFKVAKNQASPSEVIIPEGYEIQMTLTSLTPETKNLMFDSINNPVKSYEESDPFVAPGAQAAAFSPYGEEPDMARPYNDKQAAPAYGPEGRQTMKPESYGEEPM